MTSHVDITRPGRMQAGDPGRPVRLKVGTCYVDLTEDEAALTGWRLIDAGAAEPTVEELIADVAQAMADANASEAWTHQQIVPFSHFAEIAVGYLRGRLGAPRPTTPEASRG